MSELLAFAWGFFVSRSLMSRYNDLLGSAKQTNAPLYATMQAVKTAFTNRFKFDVFPLVTDDDYKGAVRNDRNIDGTKYPYQYWKVSSIEMSKEYGNVKLLRRHGSAYAGGTSNTSYSMGYFFKATLDCQLKYSTNNIQDALSLIERYLIMVGTESLNVKVNLPIGKGIPFVTRIYAESLSATFPEAVLEDENSPGTFSVELPFRVDGKIGTHKDVAKLNNEGEITYRMELDDDDQHTDED